MSIDWTDIKKNLITWVKTYSEINESGRHIWANQNAPQPKSPFVVLNIISGLTKIGNSDSMLYNKNSSTYNVSGVRLFKLEVNTYGNDALNIATRLKLSIERTDVQQFFRGVNLTPYGSTPSISNATQFLDTIYEDRALFELTFMTSYIIEMGETYVGEVTVQGINEMEKGKDNKINIGG